MSSAANLGGIFIVLDVTFCTSYKYERDRTLGDRLDSDHFRGGKGQAVCLFTFSHALKTFTRYEVVTRFRL